MTAEWLHLPPPYPPVGPLCGAELEAWYEDLQDILGSDGGGVKARAPPCPEKEPEFLDVLESCSLTWLTDGQAWGGEGGVQRVVEAGPPPQGPAPVPSTAPREEREEGGVAPTSGGGDLLPPEFFELLSEGGAGLMEGGAGVEYRSQHRPPSPTPSEDEPPSVPDSSSCSPCSSSASPSPPLPSSPPSPPSPPPSLSYRLGKRRRGGDRAGGRAPSPPAGLAPPLGPSQAKKSRKEREQENERRVQELTEQNERLKAQIERLAEEVQRTRRSLIERLVNTRK
ncbi:hypothetical protein COCON_G00183850 [Conger conger]|uniref:DNA damage-inducible transcript 3 protein n=1 Tax=Conger conger TaxID=82655 RepID=A0A9Q1D6Q6_CONCO|nr:hypothetical protein COCON_G00183850 [Conger conger]